MLMCLGEPETSGGGAPGSRGGGGGVGAGGAGGEGVAEATIVSRRARPFVVVVVGGWFTRLEVGVSKAEEKRAPRVTLLVLRGGAEEADGMSFEKKKSSNHHHVALASWDPTSVEVGCCTTQGGGRSEVYRYGSPLRMKVISLEAEKVDSAERLKNSQQRTHRPTTARVVHNGSPETRT